MESQQDLVLEGGSTSSIGDCATFGVLTVSDRASQGVYRDESGPAILQFFREAIKSRQDPPPCSIKRKSDSVLSTVSKCMK